MDSFISIAVKVIAAFTLIERCGMDNPVFGTQFNAEKKRFECIVLFSGNPCATSSKSLEVEVLAAKLNEAYEASTLEINTNFMLVEALG